jgi:uncharacterized protein (TIGR00159 family)
MQALQDVFYSISISNIVDMAIIACLIYFVLAWFKGTRSLQILATLMGLGLFYLAASRLGLILTSVLFQYLWAAIIIVLVIVFQPEIREMLDRASPIRYLSGRNTESLEPQVIDETVRAVAELSRLRIGALIVFQRLDRLDSLLLKGKPLDSFVSAEALLMIFQKTSPLHDGAVLVFGDRIKAASCILPVSTDEAISSRYGTRHRAALGIAERSDAVCAVVSEERGEVSLVSDKEIVSYRTKSEFRTALEHEMVSGISRQGSTFAGLSNLLTSNWRLKLLAMAVSVFLWFVVVGPQSSEIGISLPIQYTNLPLGMEITGTWMDRVDVRVRGSEASLANLKPGSVRAVIDLSGVVPGLNFFRISSQNLQLPPGIATAQIRPSDLHLSIEAATVKSTVVSPTIKGVVPEKLKVEVIPKEVKIKGLKEDLRLVKSVVTDPIDISELIKKGKASVPVSVQPEGLRIEAIDPPRVTVAVEGAES